MHKLVKKIESMSARERVLLFFTVLATLYFSWETLVFDNLVAAQQQVSTEADGIAKMVPILEKQMVEIANTVANNPNETLNERVQALKNETIALEKNIVGVTKQLIPADKMGALLGDIMAADRELKIIKIENIPEEPVFADGEEKAGATVEAKAGVTGEEKGATAEAKAGVTGKNMANLQVYRHGLAIEFNATYFATKRFLQALEALPWKLVLGELDYKVNEYPNATIRIVIYTLSLQKEWLSM